MASIVNGKKVKRKDLLLLFRALRDCPGIFSRKRKTIFLLSHMRSRSSLLGHILGDNPGISGYSELQINYSKKRALLKMRLKLLEEGEFKGECEYFFDKVLAGHLQVCESILNDKASSVLIMAREPKSTITSILNMGEKYSQIEWYKDPYKVKDYYVKRLWELVRYAELIRHERLLFIESQSIVNDTLELLDELSRYFGLKEPLKAQYSIRRRTGQRGYGDPSNVIKKGIVLTSIKEESDVDLPEKLVQEAENAYESATEKLRKLCFTIPSKAGNGSRRLG